MSRPAADQLVTHGRWLLVQILSGIGGHRAPGKIAAFGNSSARLNHSLDLSLAETLAIRVLCRPFRRMNSHIVKKPVLTFFLARALPPGWCALSLRQERSAATPFRRSPGLVAGARSSSISS